MRTINAVKIEGTLKRSAVVVALAAMLFAMLGVLAPAASNASSSSSSVVCKIKRQAGSARGRVVVCPTRQLRGPRGPAGPAGPAGPQGPAGPAGPAGGSGAVDVRAFNFLATGATANTTITTLTGAIAESGCDGVGDFLADRLRATADNGAANVLNLESAGVDDNENDFDIGDTVALHFDGLGDEDAQYGLTYMSAGGTENASAHYYADDTGLTGGTFDCAIFGTIQVV